jgi:ATPase family associated with various cellular activities (AAA)
MHGAQDPTTRLLTKGFILWQDRFMATDYRFMNELFRIVGGALRLDLERVRNYTSFLAEKLEESGDSSSAARLRKLLEETNHELRPASLSSARTLPVDTDSRFPLIERVNLRSSSEAPVVVSDEQSATLREFLSVVKSHAQLEAEGIATDVSLLLYGPPGCGKSRIARHVARELGLELYIARLDGLISSYLGSTSKNIRALFDFAAQTPCVLFLDEFDAIAKLRGDTQELGELKRVVNTFIQSLDTIGKQSVVVAATNHEELLDAAIWRRFTYRLELSYPTPAMRTEMWLSFSTSLRFTERDITILADLSEGFSGSDIHDTCLRLNRKRVTEGLEPTLHDAFITLLSLTAGAGEDRRFLSKLRLAPPRAIAAALRERDAQRYSHAALGELLGVSKATAYRWTTLHGVETNV